VPSRCPRRERRHPVLPGHSKAKSVIHNARSATSRRTHA
jgi:hypothetical protein